MLVHRDPEKEDGHIMKSWWLCELLIYYGAGSRLVVNWMEKGGGNIC